MTLALSVAILAAGGTYLILQRGLFRIILGFMLLSHAANLILFSAGGAAWRDAPLLNGSNPLSMADPLPQAFVLTAIVITFGVLLYMAVLAVANTKDDDTDVDADIEDES